MDGIAYVDRTKCVGCGKCAKACPQHLIEIIPDTAVYAVACASRDKGKAVKAQCAAGCIGCRGCVIRCKNGAMTFANNLAHIDYSQCTGCGDCTVKCPANVIVNRLAPKDQAAEKPAS